MKRSELQDYIDQLTELRNNPPQGSDKASEALIGSAQTLMDEAIEKLRWVTVDDGEAA